MDLAALQPLADRFVAARSSDDFIREQLQIVQRREEGARRMLQLKRIPALEPEQLATLLEDTDAWQGLRWSRQDLRRRLLDPRGETVAALRSALAALVRHGKTGLNPAGFDELLAALPEGLGTALLAELLALRFPRRYWPWNAALRRFLRSQGIDARAGLPAGRRSDPGAEYFAAGEPLAAARAALSQAAGQELDFPVVAVFAAWVNQQARTREPPAPYRVPAGAERRAARWTPAFAGLRGETFDFFAELVANNRREWLQGDEANRRRYARAVRDPLRRLLLTLAPSVAALNAEFETRVETGRVLAALARSRRDGGAGDYHTALTGSFYRRGRSAASDARLFVTVRADGVDAGLAAGGPQGKAILSRFRRNLAEAPELFLELARALPPGVELRIDGRPSSGLQAAGDAASEPAALAAAGEIAFVRHYPASEPLLHQPELAGDVANLFAALYPLWRFVTGADPAALRPALAARRDALAELVLTTLHDEAFWEQASRLLADKGQLIFYGPPGSGKTWLARAFARYWVATAPDPAGALHVAQFHPAYAYEDFVEGIRPQSRAVGAGRQELAYPVVPGLFRRLCERARARPQRRYVLVLDEINRGELPRVFGELLYLLEYRGEHVTLPYSGESFAIPSNVFLIGTMNTADRSLALVDHALRRRFHFVPARPSPAILRSYLEQTGRHRLAWLADLLAEANRRLEQDGIEWHLHIGHSHFMRPDLDESLARLIWEHSVLPALEEIFYREPERLERYTFDALRAAPVDQD